MFPVQIFRSALRSGIAALRSPAALGNITNSSTGLIKPQPCLQIRPFSSNLISNAGVLMGKPQPRLVSTVVSSLPVLASRQATTILSTCNNLIVNPSRTIMKIFWPKPREQKRIKNFSWKSRMSTPSGRKIIMRRILKGRHSLTH